MTDCLARRVPEHREHRCSGFTAKYSVDRLVWYEPHVTREDAFTRERRIKKWSRVWKLALIERANPDWRDLTGELL